MKRFVRMPGQKWHVVKPASEWSATDRMMADPRDEHMSRCGQSFPRINEPTLGWKPSPTSNRTPPLPQRCRNCFRG